MAEPSSTLATETEQSLEALLERVAGTLSLAGTRQVDTACLSEEILDLTDGLKRLTSRLNDAIEWLRQLLSQVSFADRQTLFVLKLENDAELLAETRVGVRRSVDLARESERILEAVQRIASVSGLEKLEDQGSWRGISRTLTKIGIAQDELRLAHEGLLESLDNVDRKGLRILLVDSASQPVDPSGSASASETQDEAGGTTGETDDDTTQIAASAPRVDTDAPQTSAEQDGAPPGANQPETGRTDKADGGRSDTNVIASGDDETPVADRRNEEAEEARDEVPECDVAGSEPTAAETDSGESTPPVATDRVPAAEEPEAGSVVTTAHEDGGAPDGASATTTVTSTTAVATPGEPETGTVAAAEKHATDAGTTPEAGSPPTSEGVMGDRDRSGELESPSTTAAASGETPAASEERETEDSTASSASPTERVRVRVRAAIELASRFWERAQPILRDASSHWPTVRDQARDLLRAGKTRGSLWWEQTKTRLGTRWARATEPPIESPPIDERTPDVIAQLRSWSMWRPLVPLVVEDSVELGEVTREEAVVIRLQSLFAERSWSPGPPERESQPDGDDREELWSRPVTPPAHYETSTDVVDGRETRYFVRKLERVLYSRGAIPHRLLKRGTGRHVLKEELDACASGIVSPELEDRCLQSLGPWTQETDKLREHYETDGAATSGDAETRLVRSSLWVESVPVFRVQGRLAIDTTSHGFVAWVIGNEQTLYVDGLPRTWTWKATGWLILSVLVGVPLGYLLESLIRSL